MTTSRGNETFDAGVNSPLPVSSWVLWFFQDGLGWADVHGRLSRLVLA